MLSRPTITSRPLQKPGLSALTNAFLQSVPFAGPRVVCYNAYHNTSHPCFKTLHRLPTVSRVKSKFVAVTQGPAGSILCPSLALYQTAPLTMLQPHWCLSISLTPVLSHLIAVLPIFHSFATLFPQLSLPNSFSFCRSQLKRHHLREACFAHPK